MKFIYAKRNVDSDGRVVTFHEEEKVSKDAKFQPELLLFFTIPFCKSSEYFTVSDNTGGTAVKIVAPPIRK